MGYPRLLVEMDIAGDFPETVILQDKNGVSFSQPVVYKWKPSLCPRCKKFGHLEKRSTRAGKLRNKSGGKMRKKMWIRMQRML